MSPEQNVSDSVSIPQRIRIFVFDLIFPATPLVNIAIFLFLAAILGFSLLSNYLLTGDVVKDFNNVVPTSHVAYLMEWFAAVAIMLIPFLGLMALYVYVFVFSNDTGLRDSRGGEARTSIFPGFSLLVYLLVYLGHVVASGDNDWLMIGAVMAVMFGGYALLSIAAVAEKFGLLASGSPKPLDRIELLYALLMSGGGTLYFLISRDYVVLDAVVSAYGFFIGTMILYRILANIVGYPWPQTKVLSPATELDRIDG